ncbi:MAG: FtsX-like permease family protein [Azospirillum sp.]|nr:FtsX-like permease family protein [Azospirillum sp.]
MFRQRSDLPLTRDLTGHYLAWIVAVMVYLGMLALAVALVLADMAARWETGLVGSLTVQIAPMPETPGTTGAGTAAAPLAARTELALSLLRSTPGVERVTAISATRAAELLEPWLGGTLPADLPLPALIDVVLKRPVTVDVAELAVRLGGAVPGARVDDQAMWLADLRALARLVQLVAFAIVALVGSACVIAVIFSVRAGLAIHHPVVELLHIMGATDRYVARQFEVHVLGLALRGAVGGALLALLTLYAVGHAANGLRGAMLPTLSLPPAELLLLVVVPLVACLLAVMTTRWTVRHTLAAMP